MLVRDAMTQRAEIARPDETIQAAARRMRDLGVGALVVCFEDRVLGVLTDRDIVVRSTAEGSPPAQASVRSAMTPQVIDCCEEDDLEIAAVRMSQGAVRRLAVMDAAREKLVGILSVDDIALRSPELAGEIVEHVRAPERAVRRGPWPWWESPES